MKNNPELSEFCCLHICLFNNGKANSFSDDLDTPASSFSLVLFYFDVTLTYLQLWLTRSLHWVKFRKLTSSQ